MQALYLIFSVSLHPATSIGMQDTKPKSAHTKTYNHLPTPHKTPIYYHQLPQQQQQPQQQIIYQPQYVPIQVVPKTAYVAQPQPQQIPAMIIIAAPPTPTPTYPAAIQQLLNYFHHNPHARQQLLYGTAANHPQATTPTYVVAAAPAQYYTTTPATPQYYYAAQPQQQQLPQPHLQQQQEVQPLQLQQLAEMAHATAQRLYGGQIKTATPIVTGLENFTPEQQAQIKARLNDVISQDQQQQQQHNHHHQQQQQQQHGDMSDFVPSPEIKGEEGGVAYVTESGQSYGTKG